MAEKPIAQLGGELDAASVNPSLRTFQAVTVMRLNQGDPRCWDLLFPAALGVEFSWVCLLLGRQMRTRYLVASGVGSACWHQAWRWGGQAEGACVNGSTFLNSTAEPRGVSWGMV